MPCCSAYHSADKLGRDVSVAAAAAGLAPPTAPGSVRDGAGSSGTGLARAFAKAAAAGVGGAPTPSSYSSDLSSSSAPDGGVGGSPDGTATPSAADTELAWEAGFRAGQEAAALAAQEEWQALVAKRMQYLGHVQSDYILSAADAALGHHWPKVGARLRLRAAYYAGVAACLLLVGSGGWQAWHCSSWFITSVS